MKHYYLVPELIGGFYADSNFGHDKSSASESTALAETIETSVNYVAAMASISISTSPGSLAA